MSEQNKDEVIKTLKEKIVSQNEVINTLREFFSSNSQFMKIYRQKPPYQYEKMESILATQEKIFAKFEELIKKERQS
jgi:ribosomal protein L16 Arg81 hydroxylase